MSGFIIDKRGYTYNEFELAVQMGKVDGARIEWHIASSDINNNGVEATVCHNSTHLYHYPLGYGVDADTITVTSSLTVEDNGIEIMVVGLDADGNEQREQIVIGGTTTKTYSRFFGAINVGTKFFTGTVTVAKTTGAVSMATMSLVDQRTMCGKYTIPKGKRGFLTAGELSIGFGKEALVHFKVRPFGKVFTTAQKVSITQASFRAERPRNSIEELTDVEVTMIPSANNLAFSVTFGMIILDTKIFNLEGL